MARGRFYHDPARKHIEQYQDFSGGLNTTSSNENVKDNELVYLQNVDLGERGSLLRRKGFEAVENIEAEGTPQLLTKFYRNYTPYNLLGVEGTFDGQIRLADSGRYRLGGWYTFTNANPEYIFKVDGKESEDLILNGDFEDGDEHWDLTYKGSRIFESTTTQSGKNVLLLFRDIGDMDNPKNYKNEYQSRYVPTAEGDEFYMEAYYRTAGASLADRGPRRLHLVANVRLENGKHTQLYINKFDSAREWKKISGYFKMPEGAVEVKFGVGMKDENIYEYTAGIYFDTVFAKRQIAGSENSAVGIRASLGDTISSRGMGIQFNGIEPNKYYVFLVDYRSDGSGTGGMGIRDERFGVYPEDDDLIIRETIYDDTNEWVTKYMKFQTYDGMKEGRAYLYNESPLGSVNTVFFDNARIYEVSAEEYVKIGFDPEYTGEALAEKFPFRTGKLKSEIITEIITAVGGKFYIDGVEKEVEGDLLIQSERPMEAAMYGNNLYIASGSGFLVYNGSTISKVTPYVPDILETLYIGTNGLVENPYLVEDYEQSVVQLKDIRFSRRYGVTNEFITIEVGVGKPSGTSLEYKFERRNIHDKQDYWFTIRDWHTDNQATFITDIAGEYQFRISVREEGKELILDQYMIPRYIIKPSEEEGDIPIDANTIHLCNRILVHWDRIILYGDQAKPDIIYISDLHNPAYFPMNNTLQFNNPRKERITSIVRFRDNLVVFTPTSTQALYGTNPENYQRVMLNTDLGCISDKGAEVVQNYVVFPSYEGIALLKTIGVSENRANIDIIDSRVKDLVEDTENSVAYVRNNQYCLVFPEVNTQLRWYYNFDVWTYDVSSSLDFVDAFVEDSKLTALGSDGRVIIDSDEYQDEGIPFDMVIKTKKFSFGEPYATKKMRQLQVMVDRKLDGEEIHVVLRMDTDVEISETIQITGDKVYKMAIPGRGLAINTEITHNKNVPFRLNGIGFIFKLKNP